MIEVKTDIEKFVKDYKYNFFINIISHTQYKKIGMTIVEITIVALLVSMIAGVIYKLLSGTFSSFFKSHTKLNNTRAANLIMEYIKRDLRLATIPTDNSNKPILNKSPGNLFIKFQIRNPNLCFVTYEYKDKTITRIEEPLDGSKISKKISQAKVSKFDILEEVVNNEYKFMKIDLEVDDEVNSSTRSKNSQMNKFTLSALILPKFYQKFTSKEEEYWAKARRLSGMN